MTACIGLPQKAYKRGPTMRLHNPITGKWLHNSCLIETDNMDYSWSGRPNEARVLRDRTEARGDEWLYKRSPIEQPETPSW